MSLLKLLQKTFLATAFSLTALTSQLNASPTYIHNQPQKIVITPKELPKSLNPDEYAELRKIRQHLLKIYIPNCEEYKKGLQHPHSKYEQILKQKCELIRQYPGIVINLLSDKDYERFKGEKETDLIPSSLTPRERQVYNLNEKSPNTLANQLIIFFTLKIDEEYSKELYSPTPKPKKENHLLIFTPQPFTRNKPSY